MLTWNLREAGIHTQLMHDSLAVGSVLQRWGTRNTGCLAWTEILQLYSFFCLVFLVTMWILHTKLRCGQANTLSSCPPTKSHSKGLKCSTAQPLRMQVWDLSIWRTETSPPEGLFKPRLCPSCASALISLVCHKKSQAQPSGSLQNASVQLTWIAVWKGKIFSA